MKFRWPSSSIVMFILALFVLVMPFSVTVIFCWAATKSHHLPFVVATPFMVLFWLVLWWRYLGPCAVRRSVEGMYNCRLPSSEESKTLNRVLEEICISMDIDINYFIVSVIGNGEDTLNAFAVGRKHLFIGQDIIKQCSIGELKAILAHEIGHLQLGHALAWWYLQNASSIFEKLSEKMVGKPSWIPGSGLNVFTAGLSKGLS